MRTMNLRSRVIRLAHENPDLRPHLLPLLKEAGVLQDYARHARNALKEHERERYVDDDYRRTMQEFIDMERDALPNAKKTRGGQKALEDIREEKAKSDRVFARR